MKRKKEGLRGVEQVLVGPPVLGEGEGPALLGGGKVGVDVGSPERIDGLLGVADQHDGRGPVAKSGADDPPLDRVRVLELVDQHDPVTPTQAPAGQRAPHRIFEGVGQPGKEMVVGQQVVVLQAAGHFALGLRHQTGQQPVRVVAGRRRQLHARVADGERGGQAGLTTCEGGRTMQQGPAQVQVVDHLVDEAGRVLDQGGAGRHIAGRAQPGQNQLAETVGGGDGGGVEVGNGGGEALLAVSDLGLGSARQ